MVRDGDGHWRLQKAERFLAAAVRALDQGDSETAGSPAHYAVYHAMIVMIETKTDLDVPKRHVTLHNLLNTPGMASFVTREQVSNFRRLYGARQAADYDEDTTDATAAGLWVRTAEQLCNDIWEVITRG